MSVGAKNHIARRGDCDGVGGVKTLIIINRRCGAKKEEKKKTFRQISVGRRNELGNVSDLTSENGQDRIIIRAFLYILYSINYCAHKRRSRERHAPTKSGAG
jgi:hypothetical protein